jgi:hypothetical protein
MCCMKRRNVEADAMQRETLLYKMMDLDVKRRGREETPQMAESLDRYDSTTRLPFLRVSLPRKGVWT